MFKISVIHFQPLEFFPPALNFVRYLAGQEEIRASVFTTRIAGQTFQVDLPESVNLSVTDLSNYRQGSRIARAFKYFQFNITTVFRLLSDRPDVVVYFDPYSAIPGIVYHMIPKKKGKLWIHFHEYFPPGWYARGMLMVRAAHFMEKRSIFQSALGISHTNAERIRLFVDDNPQVDVSKLFSFPNYPPSWWEQYHRRIDAQDYPIRMVALGSFTLRDTYLGEFCRWVESCKGRVELDIYSLYFDDETRTFLESVEPRWIRFHSDGIPYDHIPGRFAEAGFHVGLVLYRCNHLNTVHCVSNKVFEYLTCGLDVWYPTEMTGTTAYATNGVYPKVVPVDFQQLEELDLNATLSRKECNYVRRDFACETVYSDWLTKLMDLR